MIVVEKNDIVLIHSLEERPIAVFLFGCPVNTFGPDANFIRYLRVFFFFFLFFFFFCKFVFFTAWAVSIPWPRVFSILRFLWFIYLAYSNGAGNILLWWNWETYFILKYWCIFYQRPDFFNNRQRTQLTRKPQTKKVLRWMQKSDSYLCSAINTQQTINDHGWYYKPWVTS